jgi:hypothetical protein
LEYKTRTNKAVGEVLALTRNYDIYETSIPKEESEPDYHGKEGNEIPNWVINPSLPSIQTLSQYLDSGKLSREDYDLLIEG